MKKKLQFPMIRIPLVFTIGMITILLFARTHCNLKVEEDPYTYSPSFTVQGYHYTSGGYDFLYFELTCTTDVVEVSTIDVSGPNGHSSYSGGGEIFNQNQPIILYDEEHFPYEAYSYAFTIWGIVRSGSNSGTSFSKTVYFELVTE